MAQTALARQGRDVVSTAAHRLDHFLDVLERALEDPAASEALCKAGVRVRIDLKDLPDTAITLLLDAPPARLLRRREDARPGVQLWMSSADLEAVLNRHGHLPLQILSGAVEFEGPVRKLLRVMPILTAAVARASAGS